MPEVNLVMFKADGTRRDFPLRKDRVVVGRTGTCDLRIPLSSVSRRHCEIIVDADTVRLRDLSSSNGTFHNTTKVTESVLSPGDEIGIGPVVFAVIIDGQPSDVSPVRTMVKTRGEDAADSMAPSGQALDDPDSIQGYDAEEQYSPTVNLDEPADGYDGGEPELNFGADDSMAPMTFGDDEAAPDSPTEGTFDHLDVPDEDDDDDKSDSGMSLLVDDDDDDLK